MMKTRYSLLLLPLILAGCGTPQNANQPQPARTAVAQNSVVDTTVPTTVPATPTTITTAPTPSLVPTERPAVQPTEAPAKPTEAPAEPTSASVEPTAVVGDRGTTATPPGKINPKITLSSPQVNTEVVGNAVTIEGSTNFFPFEATLVARIVDSQGKIIGLGPITVNGEMQPNGTGGSTFQATIPFKAAAATDATLEVFEASAKDGTPIGMVKVPLHLKGGTATAPTPVAPQGSVVIDEPSGSTSLLPVHVAFHGADDEEQLKARLRFATGDAFDAPVVAAKGFGVTTMNWNTESMPPVLEGPATLEIVRADGSVAAQRDLTIVSSQQFVKVGFVSDPNTGDVVLMQVPIARTNDVGAAALNELLWGPTWANLAGFTSALPTYDEIVNYSGRDESWGYRVRLIKLTIKDGVATANFSRELQAYGGGSARVTLIRKQIEQTLLQFPSVKQVVIAVEGQTEGVLQP